MLSDFFIKADNYNDAEVQIFEQFGLERPTRIPTNARELIRRMAICLHMLPQSMILDNRPVGAPDKWSPFGKGLVLWCRVEYVILTNARKIKKQAIFFDIKKRYKYIETPKTLENRYMCLCKDKFLDQILKCIEYEHMSTEDKIDWLKNFQ